MPLSWPYCLSMLRLLLKETVPLFIVQIVHALPERHTGMLVKVFTHSEVNMAFLFPSLLPQKEPAVPPITFFF